MRKTVGHVFFTYHAKMKTILIILNEREIVVACNNNVIIVSHVCFYIRSEREIDVRMLCGKTAGQVFFYIACGKKKMYIIWPM